MSIANLAWGISNLPACRRFQRALNRPLETQLLRLKALLQKNAQTAFGKALGFESISSYEEFTRRVPLTNYDTFKPWIDRIREGEPSVLTADRVTHLIPTSGSSGARKLIPFTTDLQREFHAAIAPWLVDLQRSFPKLIGGPAYWSITPPATSAESEISAVPVGFDSDCAYLGGARETLVKATLAVPPEALRSIEPEHYRYCTLLHLLRCRDLRLISVWHPSLPGLLMDALPEHWERLLADIAHGTDQFGALAMRPLPRRARELESLDPREPSALWPHLSVISCWADGPAALAARELRRLFPKTVIQSKGLLATEGVVTLPFASGHPLAVCSHFYEFIDDSGRATPCDALKAGAEYEVVITTGGGLYRYRLGDRVRVTGRLGRTPSLQFLGRAGNVSDLFGEKLSETFVAEALRELFAEYSPRFALLAPERWLHAGRYTLYVEGIPEGPWAERLDRILRRNPHYACCRDLGQLHLPRVVFVTNGHGAFMKRFIDAGRKAGDIKPAALSCLCDWEEHFSLESMPDRARRENATTAF